MCGQDEQTRVAKEFPHLKIFKKSVLLNVRSYERRLTIPKDAASLLEAARKLEPRRVAAEDKFNEYGKLKKQLGKCSSEVHFFFLSLSLSLSLSVMHWVKICSFQERLCMQSGLHRRIRTHTESSEVT